MASPTLRQAAPKDLDHLKKINDLSTPGVSFETKADLETILELGDTHVALGGDNRVLGFINLVAPGTTAYQSPNLRWFEAWQARVGKSVLYVDRIAIDPAARGHGIGKLLYRRAFHVSGDRDGLACEVNTLPPNPGSHRFHKRLGFEQVGDQVFDPGRKAVAYYVRASARSERA